MKLLGRTSFPTLYRRIYTFRSMILLTCIWIALYQILIMHWKTFESNSRHHDQPVKYEGTDRTMLVPTVHQEHESFIVVPNKSKITKPKIRYTVDSICSNCRYVDADNRSSCQMQITTFVLTPKLARQYANQTRVNETEAATIVSTLFPNSCYRCHVSNGCNRSYRKENYYYRMEDLVTPYIEKEVTHYLNSIDTKYRLPTNFVNNLSALSHYLNQSENVYPNKRYVFEFNPSIVQLPKNQIPHDFPTARYIASYRVSTLHDCIANQTDKLNMIGGQWYIPDRKEIDDIGLALLDVNFMILTENVFDIRNTILYRGQDYRLFNLNNQLYINTFDYLVPIWIVPPLNNNATLIQQVRNGLNVSMPFHNATVLMTVSPLASSSSSSSSSQSWLKVYIRTMVSGSHDYNTFTFGKNLNFFVDPYTKRVLMETYPMGTKERYDPIVQAIVPINPKRMTNNEMQEFNRIMVSPHPSYTVQTIQPSYGTTDELLMAQKRTRRLPYTAERGSTCCVLIQDPRPTLFNSSFVVVGNTNQQQSNSTNNTATSTTSSLPPNNRPSLLLLGISHSKTRRDEKMKLLPNQFFSSFYVMEAWEPYNVVARTGRFCLGSTLVTTSNQENKPHNNITDSRTTITYNNNNNNNNDTQQLSYHNSTRTNPYLDIRSTSPGLIIGDEVYTKCPKIHFVTGMTTKVDDPTKLIITYGLNDCTSHMVVLDLQHVMKLLFQLHSLVDL